jgi:hypothetical protein
VPVDTSHPTDMASKEFRAIIPKAAATDNIRGLLLKDHDLLYKRLSSVKLTYSHGNAAGNFLEANRATGEDKETSWQSRRRPRAGRGRRLRGQGRRRDDLRQNQILFAGSATRLATRRPFAEAEEVRQSSWIIISPVYIIHLVFVHLLSFSFRDTLFRSSPKKVPAEAHYRQRQQQIRHDLLILGEQTI